MTEKKLLFPNLGGYPGWKPNKFVEGVKYAYYNNGFCDAFVESSGRKGVGKTSFCLGSGFQVYGSYQTALDHLYLTPKNAVNVFRGLLKEALENKKPVKRLPLAIIDDATMSLNKSRWFLPGIQDFAEFYNIIRSCCAGVIFSGPSLRLPESIACDIQYKIIIKSYASATRIKDCVNGNYENSNFWRSNVKRLKEVYGIKKVYLWRQAKIYTNYTIPSSSKRFISPTIHTSLFPLHYPNSIFKEYDSRRTEKVAEVAEKIIMGEPAKKIGRPMNKELLHRVVRDRYNDLKEKGNDRESSAKIIGISTESLKEHVRQANNAEKGEVLA